MTYPVYKHDRAKIQLPDGRPVDACSLDALESGALTSEDLGIRAEALLAQAAVAEEAGFRQVGENLRRAAEMTRIPDEELLDLYEALRPGRSTQSQLDALADKVESTYEAPLTASFLRDAARGCSSDA